MAVQQVASLAFLPANGSVGFTTASGSALDAGFTTSGDGTFGTGTGVLTTTTTTTTTVPVETGSAFVGTWTTGIFPVLMANWQKVAAVLLGLSMVIGFGLWMVRAAG